MSSFGSKIVGHVIVGVIFSSSKKYEECYKNTRAEHKFTHNTNNQLIGCKHTEIPRRAAFFDFLVDSRVLKNIKRHLSLVFSASGNMENDAYTLGRICIIRLHWDSRSSGKTPLQRLTMASRRDQQSKFATIFVS